MKKHLLAVFFAVLTCLTSLTGCAAVKSLERDVQVVLSVNGETCGVYTVNTFNNAVVPVPDAPEGMSFLGWTGQENWDELAANDIIVSANSGLIRYDDVKDYIQGNNRSVTLYAAFAVVPPKDLVVAWYRADGVSTDTGLDQEYMDAFAEALFAYLRTKGYTPEDMDIVMRAYDKNVGSSCGQIVADGDVDIMVGWAANINSTGGITFIENNDSIAIGSVSRYAARLTSTYLSRLAYTWILNTYGNGKYNLPEPDPNEDEIITDPEPGVEPEPSSLPVYTVDAGEQFSIKIAWYAKSETSGIEQPHMDALETALKTDLEKMGFTLANITITMKGYDGKVGPSCEAVMADGDVDIMVGWGSNIDTTGGMEGKFLENISGITVGSTARYAALLTDSDFVKVVFAWLQNTYGDAVDYPSCFGLESSAVDPDPADGPAEQAKLVIGWYAKTDTSGLTEEIMANFKVTLEKYLVSKGYDLANIELVIRAYDGSAADMGAAINGDGDADVLIGVGNNINSAAGVSIVEKEGNIPMGGQSRYVARLTETDIAKLVYAWVKTEDGYASLASDFTVPTEPAVEKEKLVVGWYAKTDTSGLTEDIMAGFETALKEYLTLQGYELGNIELIIRAYDGAAADMGAAINGDGDVDVLIGVGNNINSAAGVSIIEKEGNIPMGGKSRYVALLTETDIAKLVYAWVKTESGYVLLS